MRLISGFRWFLVELCRWFLQCYCWFRGMVTASGQYKSHPADIRQGGFVAFDVCITPCKNYRPLPFSLIALLESEGERTRRGIVQGGFPLVV